MVLVFRGIKPDDGMIIHAGNVWIYSTWDSTHTIPSILARGWIHTKNMKLILNTEPELADVLRKIPDIE